MKGKKKDCIRGKHRELVWREKSLMHGQVSVNL